MRHRILLLIVFAFTLLSGCSGATSQPFDTKIDGGTLNVSDQFQRTGPGGYRSRITVTPPATQPAAAPAAAPPEIVAVSAPAPSTAPTQIRITQAPPPPPAPTPVQIRLPNGREIVAPANSSVSIETDDTAESVKHDQAALSQGAMLRTNSKEGIASFVSSPTRVDLKPIDNDGTGGGSLSRQGGASVDLSFKTIGEAISAMSAGQKWCWGFGLLFILGGILMVAIEVCLKGSIDWPLVAVLELGGLALIALGIVVETHPMLLVFAILFALAAIGGYVLWWKFKDNPAVKQATAAAGSEASSLLARLEALINKPAAPAPAPAPAAPSPPSPAAQPPATPV